LLIPQAPSRAREPGRKIFIRNSCTYNNQALVSGRVPGQGDFRVGRPEKGARIGLPKEENEGFTGRYVWHCHILEHEDNEMMRPYDIVGA
jgi:Multicopper oxidase